MATKGIWIPVEILQDDKLTTTEKLILSEIHQLTSLEDGCYASNNHFATLASITKSNASRAITSLAKKGYIVTEIIDGSRNHKRVINLITPIIKTASPLLSKQQETKGRNNINKHSEPTLEDIKAYIVDNKLSVDAEYFYKFFSVSNWVDSNGKKVKNWKQKLLTWNNHSKPITAKKKEVLI